jgi:hypothetical protein
VGIFAHDWLEATANELIARADKRTRCRSYEI